MKVDLEQLALDIFRAIQEGKLTTLEGLKYMSFQSKSRLQKLGQQLSEGNITLEQYYQEL